MTIDLEGTTKEEEEATGDAEEEEDMLSVGDCWRERGEEEEGAKVMSFVSPPTSATVSTSFIRT